MKIWSCVEYLGISAYFCVFSNLAPPVLGFASLPEQNGTGLLDGYEQITAAHSLYVKVICKNIKEDGANTAPWVILLVASLQTDTSSFIRIRCCSSSPTSFPLQSSAIWALILHDLCMCRTFCAGSSKAGSTGLTLLYRNQLQSPCAFDFSDGGDGPALISRKCHAGLFLKEQICF